MMKEQKNDVSFIIIEYNSIIDVMQCVEAIKDRVFNLNYEIIISSNSEYSSSQQAQLINKYSSVKWCFNPENKGFAYGMNRGINIASGKYIIIQNPDTTLQNTNLIAALDFLSKNKDVGLLGPKILNANDEIQDTCRPFVTPQIILSRLYQRVFFKKSAILDNTYNYDKIQKVNWVIGAYMITSRKAINRVGLMNERFFMYVEDMEWCLRFWENNLKVVYYPDLIVKYEGDRKSTLSKSKFLPFSINKYTIIHLKNYLIFLKEHGIGKINKLSRKV